MPTITSNSLPSWQTKCLISTTETGITANIGTSNITLGTPCYLSDDSTYYALARENTKLKEENEKLKGELKMKKEDAATKTFKTNVDTFSTSYNINDDFYDFFKKYYSTNVLHPNEFSHIEEIVPNKVYRFTFNDKTVIKTVCDKSDTFDLEYAFYLALAKKLYSKYYTFEGVLRSTDEIKYNKEYIKIVKRGMKLFKSIQDEKAKTKEELERAKRRHEKLVAKKKRRDERRKAEVEEDLISVIQTAIERSKDF